MSGGRGGSGGSAPAPLPVVVAPAPLPIVVAPTSLPMVVAPAPLLVAATPLPKGHAAGTKAVCAASGWLARGGKASSIKKVVHACARSAVVSARSPKLDACNRSKTRCMRAVEASSVVARRDSISLHGLPERRHVASCLAASSRSALSCGRRHASMAASDAPRILWGDGAVVSTCMRGRPSVAVSGHQRTSSPTGAALW